MSQTAPQLDDDTIDLIDLLRILLKRKWFILGIMGFSFLLATVFVLTATARYEARSVVQIGEYTIGEPIEQTAQVVSWLSLHYKIDDARRKSFPPYIEKIQPYQKGNYVEIIAQGDKPETVQALAMEAAELVIAEHQAISQFSLTAREQQVQTIENQIIELTNQRDQFDQALKGGKVNDPLLLISLIQQRANLEARIQSLRSEALELKLGLERLRTTGTKYRLSPDLPEKPVWPPKLLIMLVALVAGGMVGTLTALVVEFFYRNWQPLSKKR